MRILQRLDSKESMKKSGEDGKQKESKNDQANKPKVKKDQDESKTDMKSVGDKGEISKIVRKVQRSLVKMKS